MASSRTVALPISHRLPKLDRATQMLILLVAIWLIRGLLYAVVNPPFESPDESSHYEYVSSFYESGGTLVTGAEAHQPPLYYWIVLPAYSLVSARWPELGLLAIRLVSVAMGAGVVLLAYLTARRLRPDEPLVYLGVTAFVAFVPEYGRIFSSANNDNLANLLSAAMICLLIASVPSGITLRSALGLLALAGLALATKATTWPVVGVVTLVLVGSVLRPALRRAPAATILSLVLLLLLIAVLPVYSRDASILQLAGGYLGSGFFAKERILTFLANLDAWPFVFQFKTFWMTFRNDAIQLPSELVAVLLAATAAAVTGLGLRMVRRAGVVLRGDEVQPGRRGFAFQLLLMGSMVAFQWLFVFLRFYREKPLALAERTATAGWDYHFSLMLGRFLYPVMIPIAIFFVWGLAAFVPARWRPFALVALLTFLFLIDWVSLGSFFVNYYSWEQ